MKVISTLALLLLLSACSGTPTTGPRATVQMRDGSRVSGMVLSSTAAELRIAGDDNVARTIPMTQVRSVVYDEAPAAAPTQRHLPFLRVRRLRPRPMHHREPRRPPRRLKLQLSYRLRLRSRQQRRRRRRP